MERERERVCDSVCVVLNPGQGTIIMVLHTGDKNIEANHLSTTKSTVQCA